MGRSNMVTYHLSMNLNDWCLSLEFKEMDHMQAGIVSGEKTGKIIDKEPKDVFL